MAQGYVSPGAMASAALLDFMREREAVKRQAMLDEIAKQREERIGRNEDAQSQRAQTELEMRQANQGATSIGMFGRVDATDPSAALIRRHMPGVLSEDKTLAARTMSMEAAPGIMIPGQELAPTGTGQLVSAGTDAQRRDFSDDQAKRAEAEEMRRFRDEQAKAERASRAAEAEARRLADAEQKERDRELRMQLSADANERAAADRALRRELKEGSGGPNAGATYADERGQRALDMIADLETKATGWTVGPAGAVLKGVPGTAAHNMMADLEALGASIAFGELTEMREASKTGGALGNVSNIELSLLQNALGALRQSQTKEAFLTNLGKVRERLERWRQIKADAMAGKYASQGGRAQGAGPARGGAPATAAPTGGQRVGRFLVEED